MVSPGSASDFKLTCCPASFAACRTPMADSRVEKTDQIACTAVTSVSWSERRNQISHSGAPTIVVSEAAPAPPPARRTAPPAYMPSENLSSVGIPAALSEGIQKAMHDLELQHGHNRRGSVIDAIKGHGDIDRMMKHTLNSFESDLAEVNLMSPSAASVAAASASVKSPLALSRPSPVPPPSLAVESDNNKTASSTEQESRSVKFSSKKLCYAASIQLGKTRIAPPEELAKKPAIKMATLKDPITVQLIERFRKEEAIMSSYRQAVLRGAQLLKFSQSGEPQSRWIVYDSDLCRLRWAKKQNGSLDRDENLMEVYGIHYGVNSSKRLTSYDKQLGKPWLCFSIHLPHRTVDLQCETEEQVVIWLFGLQSLCNVIQGPPLTYGRFLWERAKMKVEQRALRAKTTPMDMWLKMIAIAQTACAAEGSRKSTQKLNETAYPVSPMAKLSTVAASALAASSGSTQAKVRGGFMASLFKW